MTLRDDVARLLDDDRLDDAIGEAKDQVKKNPSEKEGRYLYIDLLVLAGDFEKADAQCNVASTFAPQDAVGFSLFRHHLRAMAARNAWFETGAVPDFTHGPSELDQLAIKANIAARDGDVEAARTALAELDERRAEISLSVNGGAPGYIRDLDDRVPHALEVLTNGGKYLWIGYDRIESVAIEPMSRPRDLAYRQAELTLRDGAIASVLLPAIYHGKNTSTPLLLGRETLWSEDTALVTGTGQRCLLVGDDLMPFHEISSMAAAVSRVERQSALG